MTIIVKIGSNCLLDENQKLDKKRIKSIIEQIIKIKKTNQNIILISSGAIACGRSIINDNNLISNKNQIASIGQYELMHLYNSYVIKKGFFVGQFLISKNDILNDKIFDNIIFTILSSDNNKIIPILNENDAISFSDFRFTDNDELTFHIAKKINPSKVIFLTSVDGLYKDDKLIKIIKSEDEATNINFFTNTIAGTGGMKSKINICLKLAQLGIMSHIYNGRDKNALLKVIKNPKKYGTTIYPNKIVDFI